MTISTILLRDKFSHKNIKDYYLNNVNYNCAPGIDKINKRIFNKKLPFYIRSINRKVLNGTYEFTPYREMLVLKNKDKPPRVISIPTMRDKITLGIIKNILHEKYCNNIKHQLVQQLIENIKKSLPEFNYIIKLDVQDFFPSVHHDILFDQLKRDVRSAKFLSLIQKAITTPTVPEKSNRKNYLPNQTGIPQGLPISNILSSIYFLDIDKKYRERKDIKYYRFVDDILILCCNDNKDSLTDELMNDIGDLKLKINSDKIESHSTSEEFTYLGYCFKNGMITVRTQTLKKLENALESLFTEYKNSGMKRTNFFLWKLNLKITGCVHDGEKYGWVFFFSQIDDRKVLYHLDWMVTKLIRRFKLEKKLANKSIKRFLRTHWEIIGNLSDTNYLVNFDKFTLQDKERFLMDMEFDVQLSDEEYIERTFYQVIFRSVRDLERDIQNLRERY